MRRRGEPEREACFSSSAAPVPTKASTPAATRPSPPRRRLPSAPASPARMGSDPVHARHPTRLPSASPACTNRVRPHSCEHPRPQRTTSAAATPRERTRMPRSDAHERGLTPIVHGAKSRVVTPTPVQDRGLTPFVPKRPLERRRESRTGSCFSSSVRPIRTEHPRPVRDAPVTTPSAPPSAPASPARIGSDPVHARHPTRLPTASLRARTGRPHSCERARSVQTSAARAA